MNRRIPRVLWLAIGPLILVSLAQGPAKRICSAPQSDVAWAATAPEKSSARPKSRLSKSKAVPVKPVRKAAVSGKARAVKPVSKRLPRLVDLGAKKCVPGKMMAPILEELKESQKGRLEVSFIDVWVNPRAADGYNIRLIPTQIFYDASGKEFFRHEGFYSKEEIHARFRERGIRLAASMAR